MESQAIDAESTTKKYVHPQRNPQSGPHASRRKTYWPPVAGIIAPSSAYASAPKKESTPVKIHAPTIHAAEGRLRATRLGTRKIPAPMMVPVTIAAESRRPSLRGRSFIFGRRWTQINADEESRQAIHCLNQRADVAVRERKA